MRAAVDWACRLRLAHPAAAWARLPLWFLAHWVELVYLLTGRLPK